MSEAAHLAKTAREHLAAALKALQSNSDVPVELVEAAEPIAEAMSVLHRVERTAGANLEGCDLALVNVRAALEKIQQVQVPHPATEIVMEAVAGSLSKVHALARLASTSQAPPRPATAAPPRPTPQPIPGPPAVQHVAAAAAPQPVMTHAVAQPLPASPPRASATPVPGGPATGPMGTLIQLKSEQNPFAAAPVHAPPQAFVPLPNLAATLPIPEQSYVRTEPPPQYTLPVPAQPAHVEPVYAQPTPAPAYAPAPAPRAAPSTATTVPATPNAGRIDVELGIHSASNFYKGLSGNDVLEAGGIFVATYKVPKLGATVNLRVLLPGNFEFNAIAVVQWTRVAGDGSEPGFGARFTEIGADARQLAHRYARNREPMFYDDL